jgi:excisionase family DNA binding protein
MNELLTYSEIAELTGLKYDTIYRYRKQNTLPAPDLTIGRTPVWKRQTINEWISKRNEVEVNE